MSRGSGGGGAAVVRRAAGWLALAVAALPLAAAEIPADLARHRLASGLTSPTDLELLPDGTLLVAEQSGAVLALEPGASALREVFRLAGVDTLGERGLANLEAHPDFAANRWLYLYATMIEPVPHNRLLRVTLSPTLAATEETVLWELPPAGLRSIHNGGGLAFAADGTLLVGVGDHDRRDRAPRPDHPFGKLHRLRDDGTPAADNPFPAAQPSLWARGLRNPYNLAFSPDDPALLYVNDVGSMAFEEVDRGVAGADYGWPSSEGSSVLPGQTAPVHAYPHADGACAITGGAFVPGDAATVALRGRYLFVDYCAGWLRALDPASGAATPVASLVASGLPSPTRLEVDAAGTIYLLGRGARDRELRTVGILDRLTPLATADPLPRIVVPPQSVTVSRGGVARFVVEVDNAERITWRRDGTRVAGATGEVLELRRVTLADDGARLVAVARNAAGAVVSSPAILRVVDNRPPEVEIIAPTAPAIVDGGRVLTFAGQAIDPEDGPLPGSALTWSAVLHHEQHVHPLLAASTGATGELLLPPDDHGPGMVWYELRLTARDADGATATAVRALVPRSLVAGRRPDVLLLDGGALAATLTYFDPGRGRLRSARARSHDDGFGAFWMFHPENPEVLVATEPGHQTLRAGTLTHVDVTLSVLEVATGRVRSYASVVGNAECIVHRGAFPAAAAAVAASVDTEVDTEVGEEILDLHEGRFRLRLHDAEAPDGGSAALATAFDGQSGAFTFAGEAVPAVGVKILDGRSFSGTWWLFATSLVDRGLTLEVATEDGTTRTYDFAAGACHAFSDLALPDPVLAAPEPATR